MQGAHLLNRLVNTVTATRRAPLPLIGFSVSGSLFSLEIILDL